MKADDERQAQSLADLLEDERERLATLWAERFVTVVGEETPLASSDDRRCFAQEAYRLLAEACGKDEDSGPLVSFFLEEIRTGALRKLPYAGVHRAVVLLERLLQERLLVLGRSEEIVPVGRIFAAAEERLIECFLEERQSTIRHQEELLRRQENLALLGSFASTIAHEVRTPLTSIKMNLQMLEEKAKGSGLAPHFAITRREVERLEKLITDVLSFGRPIVLQRRPRSVAALLDEAVRYLREKLSQRGIEVERSYQPDLPIAWVDPEALLSAFTNLVENAVDAMPQGGILTLRLSRSWSEAFPSLVVEVTDTGCGIPEETWPQLFDPFFTSKRGGTGLGLAIAASIVKSHGGEIRFISQPGAGSTFTVLLPLGEETRAKR